MSKRGPTPKPLAERFWPKVTKGPDCWLWQGTIIKAKGKLAYGLIKVTGERRQIVAHRAAWELTHGPVPDGLIVCHRCDNPRCVRPDHLFLGTYRDNFDDMLNKGRGESLARKLSVEGVQAIRARYATGGISKAQLAREYSVTWSCIDWVVRRKCWKDVA